MLTDDELRMLSEAHVEHVLDGDSHCGARDALACDQWDDWPCKVRRLIDDCQRLREAPVEIVELLVEIPGLPVQVGRFKRVGIFDLVLQERLEWMATSAGHSEVVWAGPTDWAWRYPGQLKVSRWDIGSTIVLPPGGLTITVPTNFEDVALASPPGWDE